MLIKVIETVMDQELTTILSEEGLEECINILINNYEITSLETLKNQVYYIGIDTILENFNDDIPKHLLHTLKNLINTLFISNHVSQSHGFEQSQIMREEVVQN